MKSKFAPVLNFIAEHLLTVYLLCVLFMVLVAITNMKAEHNRSLQKKDLEISELRRKIDNHLIAERFYDKPAKDVIPVLKDFGISF